MVEDSYRDEQLDSEVDVCKDNDGKFRSPMTCVDLIYDGAASNAVVFRP